VILLAGGEQLPPFTPAALFTQAEPFSLATAVVVVAAVAYALGLARLRGRGIAWPVGRTVAFGAGLFVIAFATGSGLEAYDTTLLSTHMVQHMLLGMVGPILLALGAPVTLALRVLTPGPRRGLLAVLHSRVAAVLTFPLVSFALFVASPFALYFSGLYRASLEYPWVHELVHAHFVIVGCLFFWPLIGIDPVPGRMSYPLRALIAFLSTPFHTVLGLTVMSTGDLLGGDWYPSLHLTWADPNADQNLAGGILWAGGEFVAVAMIAAMVWQWMRASERESARIDRALDRAEAEEPEWQTPWFVREPPSGGPVGSTGSYEAETHR
jgi:cytochrome c oxidase assembly factor CtaG